jgi:hypothetical protein
MAIYDLPRVSTRSGRFVAMSSGKLFRLIVGYGIALTAVVQTGAACSCHNPRPREGPPPHREGAHVAPAGHVMTGRVTNAGAPVADARVEAVGVHVPVTTDANGAFTLQVQSDDYRDVAIRVTAGDRTKTVTVPLGTSTIEIDLAAPDAPVDAGSP